MAYDFTTDITNFTRTSVDASIISWAVTIAKTIYIAGDPADYDEDLSDVDNILVSILASAFVVKYENGTASELEFSLDELSIKEKNSGSEAAKFFKMFTEWLNMYKLRNVSLQYKETDRLIDVTAFTPTDFVTDNTIPDGGDA